MKRLDDYDAMRWKRWCRWRFIASPLRLVSVLFRIESGRTLRDIDRVSLAPAQRTLSWNDGGKPPFPISLWGDADKTERQWGWREVGEQPVLTFLFCPLAVSLALATSARLWPPAMNCPKTREGGGKQGRGDRPSIDDRSLMLKFSINHLGASKPREKSASID